MEAAKKIEVIEAVKKELSCLLKWDYEADSDMLIDKVFSKYEEQIMGYLAEADEDFEYYADYKEDKNRGSNKLNYVKHAILSYICGWDSQDACNISDFFESDEMREIDGTYYVDGVWYYDEDTICKSLAKQGKMWVYDDKDYIAYDASKAVAKGEGIAILESGAILKKNERKMWVFWKYCERFYEILEHDIFVVEHNNRFYFYNSWGDFLADTEAIGFKLFELGKLVCIRNYYEDKIVNQYTGKPAYEEDEEHFVSNLESCIDNQNKEDGKEEQIKLIADVSYSDFTECK